MAEGSIKYLNDSNNNEFIEIYEDEIKRLIKNNEALRVSLEKKENGLMVLQHDNTVMQKELDKLNSLAVSIEQLTKQNELYKEKVDYLTNEKVKLTSSIDGLRKNALKYQEYDELSTKLEIEKQKVATLQEKLKTKSVSTNSMIEEKEANIKKQLIEEKTELAEMLLEARLQSKNLIDKANKEANKIKEAANKELEKSREEVRSISEHLKKMKNESSIFVCNLIEEFDNILN